MNNKSVQNFHHGILAIIALLYSWATIYNKPKAVLFSSIIGFGTYFIYRLAFYQPVLNLKNFKISLKIKPSKLDIFFVLIVCIITFYNLTTNCVFALVITGLLSGFYFLIIQHPKFKLKGIRSFPITKNVFLAIMWTIGTIILPVYFVGNLNIIYTTIISRFVYLLIICVAIDLRDIKADQKAKTVTLPTWIGFKNTKLTCLILLAIYFAFITQLPEIDTSSSIPNAEQLMYYGTGAILGLILIYLKPKLERRIFTKLLDGCMLMQAAGLFIISALKIG